MSVIHAPREPELDVRHGLFPAVLAVALLVLLVRLWYLQVVRSSELIERAQYYARASVETLAPRGLIVDRNGQLLAGVEPRVVVTARPAVVQASPWVLGKVAAMLGVDEQRLVDKVKDASFRPYLPAPIHVGASVEVATRIAESSAHLPGIEVSTQPMRLYSDSVALAHVLGYVWTPNGNDVKRLVEQGIKAAPYVGKLGVERVYERELMGALGAERFEVDLKRRPTRAVGRDSPVPGNRITLSIDGGLQKLAQQLLAGYRGSIVAIEPGTGEVLCLASSPSYDTKLFEGGIGSKDWLALNEDPGRPLINRAIASFHAPGSTFKIVTTLAAARAGVLDPNRSVFCAGYYEVGNRRSKCLGHHGRVTFQRAFTKSCNTYFCDLAVRTGKDMLVQTALDCGMGLRTGIDLVGEGRGVVPTDEWIARWRDPPRWYLGDTVNLGIGQGEISVTPLQMANLVALVANRGVQWRPHLVRAVQGPGATGVVREVPREAPRRIDVPDRAWNELIRAMNAVVDEGTAVAARIPGLSWGGKTGSAERRGQRLTDSWFVGFGPMSRPQIAVCVSVENVGHGSDFAAPIARAIVKRYVLGKSSAAASNTAAAASASNASGALPSAR